MLKQLPSLTAMADCVQDNCIAYGKMLLLGIDCSYLSSKIEPGSTRPATRHSCGLDCVYDSRRRVSTLMTGGEMSGSDIDVLSDGDVVREAGVVSSNNTLAEGRGNVKS